MNYADRVKDSTTSTGPTSFTLSGAAITSFQSFATAFPSGGSNIPVAIVDSTGGSWVAGSATLSGSTLTLDTIYSSSNNGAAVTFGAGAKSVFVTIPASLIAKLLSNSDVAFSTSIPLTTGSICYMPQQNVSGVLAFTVASSPVKGSSCYVRLVADGTNVPTFTGMKEWGGSLGYLNTSGITNEITFWYDGYDYWYCISQAVNAVAVDTTAPTASSAAVANATPTIVAITMSEAMDPAYVPSASAFTVTGHTVSSASVSGSTVSLTVSAAFVNGETRTVSYVQPGSNAARDLAGNLLASFSNLSITNNVIAPPGQVTGLTIGTTTSSTVALSWTAPSNGGTPTDYIIEYKESSSGTWLTFADGTSTTTSTTVTGLTASTAYDFRVTATNSAGNGTASSTASTTTSASATVPGAPTIGTATAGDASASVTFTAPASNGGAAITGYTVTSTPGGITASGSSSPITVTGLTNGTSYTFTVHATNSVGNSAESSASNSVTPTAASYIRLSPLALMTESGTGPYTYTGTNTSYSTSTAIGGIANVGLQSGVDGALSCKFTGFSTPSGTETMIGIQTGSTVVSYNNLAYSFYTQRSGNKYVPFTAGTAQTPTNNVVPANGDVMQLRRAGTTLIAEVSKDNGSTWTTIYTWSGVSTGAYKYQVVSASSTGTVTNLAGTGLA